MQIGDGFFYVCGESRSLARPDWERDQEERPPRSFTAMLTLATYGGRKRGEDREKGGKGGDFMRSREEEEKAEGLLSPACVQGDRELQKNVRTITNGSYKRGKKEKGTKISLATAHSCCFLDIHVQYNVCKENLKKKI